ncbi:selenocysteine-specific translation elongation factor [soil metagenome]
MHSLILGTAGHIDHGKTSLVKALTGVDTDRLPEEKARGITIDLGFAALDLGDIRLGIVDVPGHERFIRNMLAGATGIDLALLVVAADDSVMPQTREHLEILQYLGIRHGVIALTKSDLVDETTLEVTRLEVQELVKGTFLEGEPIIATSANTGLGIEELKAAFRDEARWINVPGTDSPFQLSIDRVFVRQGFGTVVTGTVRSGDLKTGDEIDWHHEGEIERVRVRGLAHHGETVEAIHRGQRAAINLAGVPHERMRRGHELANVGYLQPSRLFSVRLRASPNGRRIKHRLPVRLHLGTAEVMATVSLLDCDFVEPGQSALAQLFLEEPVTAVWHQPFVIRDSSAEVTLGGGQVLQPLAGKIRRRDLESLVKLEELEGEVSVRVAAAVWFANATGMTSNDLPQVTGVLNDQCESTLAQLQTQGTIARICLPQPQFFHDQRVRAMKERVANRLAASHAEHPLMTNHERLPIQSSLAYLGEPALTTAIIDSMIAAKQLVGDSKRIALASFKPKLTANQRKLKDKIVEAHRLAAFAPPEPASFANLAMGNAAALGDIYEVAVAEGLLVKVTGEIYLHAEAEQKLRAIIQEKLADGRGATMAEIRDWLGSTRKFAVPLCEYLDRVGVTVRNGDTRVLK